MDVHNKTWNVTSLQDKLKIMAALQAVVREQEQMELQYV